MTANKATPEELARRFHETYERLAPQFGYMTNEATRKWNPESANGKLMIAAAADLIESLVQKKQQEPHVDSSVTVDQEGGANI